MWLSYLKSLLILADDQEQSIEALKSLRQVHCISYGRRKDQRLSHKSRLRSVRYHNLPQSLHKLAEAIKSLDSTACESNTSSPVSRLQPIPPRLDQLNLPQTTSRIIRDCTVSGPQTEFPYSRGHTWPSVIEPASVTSIIRANKRYTPQYILSFLTNSALFTS